MSVPADAPLLIGAPAEMPITLQSRLALECAALREVLGAYLFQLLVEESNEGPHVAVGLVLAPGADFRATAERLAKAVSESSVDGPIEFVPLSGELLDTVRSYGILVYEST